MGSSSEMCSAGGFGARIDIDKMPVALAGLSPFVVAMAETQERMLWAVPPSFTTELLALYNERFTLPEVSANAKAAVIGTVTREPWYVLSAAGRSICDLPIDVLTQPVRASWTLAPSPPRSAEVAPPPLSDVAGALLRVLSHQDVCSRRPLVEHYDSVVRGATAIPSGYADAGVLVVRRGSPLAIAISVDGNARFGAISAKMAAAHAVVESARNVAAVGALPIGLTDCLNYGNPEDPVAYRELADGVEGLAEAARAITVASADGLPFVSGNVSLYNHSASGSCDRAIGDRRLHRSHRERRQDRDDAASCSRTSICICSAHATRGWEVRCSPMCCTCATLGRCLQSTTTKSMQTSAPFSRASARQHHRGARHLRWRPARVRRRDVRGRRREGSRSAPRCFLWSSGPRTFQLVGALRRSGRLRRGDSATRRSIDSRTSLGARVLRPIRLGHDGWHESVRSRACVASVSPTFRTLDASAPGAVRVKAPRVAVLVFPGTNSEDETVDACTDAGTGRTRRLWSDPPSNLRDFAGYVLPGGFAYEDRVRAGAIAAKSPSVAVVAEEAQRGKLVLGLCNGAQVLGRSRLARTDRDRP